MYQKSIDRLDKIIELFNAGETFTVIGEKVGTHRDVVKRHLIKAGIEVDKIIEERYRKKLEQVIVLYEEGKSQCYIEQHLGLTRKTIRELLKGKDVKYKTKSEQWLIRYGNTVNEAVFDTITPESSYWIGMLYADGHIGGNDAKGHNIELALESGDIKHIEKFKSFLECSNIIENFTRRVDKNTSRLRVGSEKIHKKLKEYGFTNTKSYTAAPPKILENNRDFWRGVIDGDGGVYKKDKIKYQVHQVFLCGTLDTICGFITFCENNTAIKNRKYPCKCFGKNLYQVSYYSQEAIMVLDVLYKDASVYLDRKYATYKEIMQETVVNS